MYDQTTWEQAKDDREDELRKMASRSAVTIINPLAKLTVSYQLKTGQNSRPAAEFLYHKVND